MSLWLWYLRVSGAKIWIFTHFKKDFPSIFPVILILERNSRFHRSVDFHSFIVPFLRRNGERNGTERNDAEQERENTGTNEFTHTLYTFYFFLKIFLPKIQFGAIC